LSCPTCKAIELVLRGARVPKPVAKKVAYDNRVRGIDSNIKSKVKRRVASTYAKKLGKHLKETNKKARKKNGDFKKGWTQRRIMIEAQKCVKKEMKK